MVPANSPFLTSTSLLARFFSTALRFGVLAAFLLPKPALAEETWRAGVAKVRITPEVPMPMAGYASRGAAHAQGTLNELWAKALVLEDAAGHRGVLVTLDLCGIDREIALRMRKSITEATDYTNQDIVLSVSHTHSGPVVAGNLRPMHYALYGESDRKLVDAYAAELVQKVTECVVAAHAKRQPSKLAHGKGQATFAVNRRNNAENAVPELREAGKLVGPVDHDVPVLSVTQDGKQVAVLFGYACHCTTLSDMQWSSDYAGFAQDEIEDAHPGCIAMFWAGCGADQNPLPRRKVALAKAYGHELAAAVQSTLVQPLEKIEASLKTYYREIELPFGELPSKEQLRVDTQSQNIYIASRAKHLLQQIESGEPLSPTYPYPIACWKLGQQVDLVSLGGEVVVDYAIAIKAAAPAEKSVWVMGYANDIMAYIPSRRVLAEGGYEGGGAMVYYGLPTSWSPAIEPLILDEVERAQSK